MPDTQPTPTAGERELLDLMAQAETRAAAAPPVVRADPESRLDQLVAEYALIKPKADEYAAKLKTLTDGIKTELTTRHPGREEIILVGTGLAEPLVCKAVVQWRLKSDTLKKLDPVMWARCANKITMWKLSRMKTS